MPAGLKITLTQDEDRTFKELESAEEIPRRTKRRASVLRLNSRGWTVKAIAEYLEWIVEIYWLYPSIDEKYLM